jgi:hypothetical protein
MEPQMNEILAYLVDCGQAKAKWVCFDKASAEERAADKRLPPVTVTPLVAAPPQQSVEQARALLDEYGFGSRSGKRSHSRIPPAVSLDLRRCSARRSAAADVRAIILADDRRRKRAEKRAEKRLAHV